MLVAAWLWLPRLKAKEARVAAAHRARGGRARAARSPRGWTPRARVIDYQSWNWFGGKDVTFDWNHSYGPLDWPREGTTLLQVKSDKPLYWKAETLDAFDGLRWVRTSSNERTGPGGELPPNPRLRWDEEFRVTVRSLRTDFVVGAGTPYLVTGAGGADQRLGRRHRPPARRAARARRQLHGCAPTCPNPRAREMRAAPSEYDLDMLQYTRVELPLAGETAISRDLDRATRRRPRA